MSASSLGRGAAPGDVETRILDVCETIEAIVADAGADSVSDETTRRLAGALVALYGQKADARGEIFGLELGAHANATAVLMTTTALLKGSNLQLFELGMWQSWSGMK